MAPKLSPLTQQLVECLFDPGDQAEAAQRLIETCGQNLPFCQDQDEYQLERIRLAVLRLSFGYLADLQRAIGVAQQDWRDVLVAAGFGETLTAPQAWAQSLLSGQQTPWVVMIVGLPGAGKTIVGSSLARRLNWMYYETDNFLPTDDFNHMIRGEALTAAATAAWLDKLQALLGKYIAKRQSVVLACSALLAPYRQTLRLSSQVHFVYLRGTYPQLEARQRQRQSHLPHLERLAYQYSLFAEPNEVLTFDISQTPPEIVAAICRELKI